MLLAIDVGNTHTVCGVWDGKAWLAIWRRATNTQDTEDEVAVWLKGVFDLAGIPWAVDAAICGSVVPAIDKVWSKAVEAWLTVPLRFLKSGAEVGLPVTYHPPTAVRADRIANALAALERFKAPIIGVDFGTATTFDTIDRNGTYVGGAILTGVTLSSQALFDKAAKLPRVEYVPPEHAIGTNTVESLQSGIMFGYAGAIDALAGRINKELGGGATILATGGLGGMFVGLCESLTSYEPNLTLDGLVVASNRLASAL